jgi:hypothetical protein
LCRKEFDSEESGDTEWRYLKLADRTRRLVNDPRV